MNKQQEAQVTSTPPKELDNLSLLELVCQLHSRALTYQTKEMHDAYVGARNEMESRLSQFKSVPQSAGVRPDIKNYFGSMDEAHKEYMRSPKLFIYVKDLENYIDRLEYAPFSGQDAGQDAVGETVKKNDVR